MRRDTGAHRACAEYGNLVDMLHECELLSDDVTPYFTGKQSERQQPVAKVAKAVGQLEKP
jgi:hypothetical protein